MNDNSDQQKRKVLIFSCNGGGGHVSAALAIESYLPHHEVKTIDALGDTLATLDPFYYVTFGRYTGQDIYNFLLRYNYKRFANWFFHFGYLMRNVLAKKITAAFDRVIKQEEPDVIISVIPLVNPFLCKIARKKNIPFILVPTDLDISTFIKDVAFFKSKSAILSLGFSCPEIKQPIDFSFIPAKQIKITGFPIRKAFFEKKDILGIKNSLLIDEYKPIVLLVMGATGSASTLKYLQQLIKINVPFHVIVCIGRSFELRTPVEKVDFPSHITYTVFDGMQDISQAMAIADLCITKPGSVTFSEVLYMNIPVLIDNTTPALSWEQLNLELVKTYGLGNIITSYQQVKKMVTSYLVDKQLRSLTKRNIQLLEKKDFGKELSNLLEHLH